MRVDQLLQRVQADPDAAPPDWVDLRAEIQQEHAQATTTEARVAWLGTFNALMDLVERSAIVPENLANFRQTRARDYRQMVLREAQIGEHVCAETLDAVTRREVDAGRLSPDDELRRRAVREMAAPHPTRAQLMAMDAQKRAQASQLTQTQPASRWRRALTWWRRT